VWLYHKLLKIGAPSLKSDWIPKRLLQRFLLLLGFRDTDSGLDIEIIDTCSGEVVRALSASVGVEAGVLAFGHDRGRLLMRQLRDAHLCSG